MLDSGGLGGGGGGQGRVWGGVSPRTHIKALASILSQPFNLFRPNSHQTYIFGKAYWGYAQEII